MTPQEFMIGCEHDGSYIPVNEVIRLMTEYSRIMCDKQKEICFTHALPYKQGGFGNYYYQSDIKVEKESVINAPYPEELT